MADSIFVEKNQNTEVERSLQTGMQQRAYPTKTKAKTPPFAEGAQDGAPAKAVWRRVQIASYFFLFSSRWRRRSALLSILAVAFRSRSILLEKYRFFAARRNGLLPSNAFSSRWNRVRRRAMLSRLRRWRNVSSLAVALASAFELTSRSTPSRRFFIAFFQVVLFMFYAGKTPP